MQEKIIEDEIEIMELELITDNIRVEDTMIRDIEKEDIIIQEPEKVVCMEHIEITLENNIEIVNKPTTDEILANLIFELVEKGVL